MSRRAWRSIGGQRACGEQRRRRERTTGIGLRDDNASRGRRHKGQRGHPRSSPGITARQPTARLDPCTPRRTHADHAGMTADRFRRGSVSAHHGRRSTPRAKRAPVKLVDLNQHRRSSRARTPSTLTPATRTCAGSPKPDANEASRLSRRPAEEKKEAQNDRLLQRQAHHTNAISLASSNS